MKWEYKVHTINTGSVVETVLDRFGKEGWELVTAHEYHDHILVYLKRPYAW